MVFKKTLVQTVSRVFEHERFPGAQKIFVPDCSLEIRTLTEQQNLDHGFKLKPSQLAEHALFSPIKCTPSSDNKHSSPTL